MAALAHRPVGRSPWRRQMTCSPHALLTLMHLIEAQILRLRLIRRAAEEECEVFECRR
jgi:hypothetical protein